MSNLKPNIGDDAPDFKIRDTNGNLISLSNFKGKTIIMYFYPKDDTPGCTKEACNFRDDYSKYKDLNTVILGVSPNNQEDHKKFTEKYSLPFPLLCDIDQEICKKYGVWQKKSMYGREYMGVVRTTFIINKNLKIKHIFENVKVDNHSNEILEKIKH